MRSWKKLCIGGRIWRNLLQTDCNVCPASRQKKSNGTCRVVFICMCSLSVIKSILMRHRDQLKVPISRPGHAPDTIKGSLVGGGKGDRCMRSTFLPMFRIEDWKKMTLNWFKTCLSLFDFLRTSLGRLRYRLFTFFERDGKPLEYFPN